MSPSMPLSERQMAEHACASLINRFAACLDGFDYDGVLALLTPECLWHGKPDARGHTAVRARLDARPRDLQTLHVVTGTVVDVEGTSARARSVVTVYRFLARGAEAAAPPKPSPPHTIGIYDDRFERMAAGWLLAERSLTPWSQA